MRKALLVAVLVSGALPAFAQETTLAEAAEKQKKARKAQPAKVFTEDDLKGSKAKLPAVEGSAEGAPADAKGAAGAADAKGAKTPEKTEEQLRNDKKADLEKQLQAQLDIIAKIQKLSDDAQRELNDNTNLVQGGRRAALMRVLEDDKQTIAKAQETIEGIREQARRAGIALSR